MKTIACARNCGNKTATKFFIPTKIFVQRDNIFKDMSPLSYSTIGDCLEDSALNNVATVNARD